MNYKQSNEFPHRPCLGEAGCKFQWAVSETSPVFTPGLVREPLLTVAVSKDWRVTLGHLPKGALSLRWRWSGSPLLKVTVGLVVGEQAQGGTRSSRGAQGIWGTLFLYFSLRLWWDVWEKRGSVVWWIGPVLEDSSGIKSWLCDPVKSYNLSEPHVCHV